MKKTAFKVLVCAIAAGTFSAVSAKITFAQSQALNGQIEGTVLDQNKAAVPNAVITVTNIESGATRTVATDESGVYRFPLLPLGTYRISAQATETPFPPSMPTVICGGLITNSMATTTRKPTAPGFV